MKAKYFCILAYKHEIDYKGLSHKQREMANNGAINKKSKSTWSSRGGLVVNLSSCTGSFTSRCQPGLTERNPQLKTKYLQIVDHEKMVVCWFI